MNSRRPTRQCRSSPPTPSPPFEVLGPPCASPDRRASRLSGLLGEEPGTEGSRTIAGIMSETIKVLAVGDLIGRPGRRAAIRLIPQLRRELGIDIVVANGE